MKGWLLLALLALTTLTARAQAPDEARVRELLEVTGSGKLGATVMENMINQFRTSNPRVPETFWEEFRKEVKPEDLVELVVPIYQRNFTAAEVEAMLAFYKSEAGQSVLRKMPTIVQESMAVGQQWGTQIAERALERLKAQGYGQQ